MQGHNLMKQTSLLFLILSVVTSFSQAAQPNYHQKTMFFGHDDRVKTKPDQAPWLSVGQLETKSGTICTGTLVAPDVVLTAGHCFIDKGKFDPAISFTVGLWGEEHTARSKVTEVQVDHAFLKGLVHVSDGLIIPPKIASRDFAFMRLAQPLGKQQGVVPVFNGNKADLKRLLASTRWKITQGGYPVDEQTHLLVHHNCLATGLLKDGRITHHCDTLAGDSGSPILLIEGNKPVIIGIQSSAPDASNRKKADNMALSSPVFFEALQRFINKPKR